MKHVAWWEWLRWPWRKSEAKRKTRGSADCYPCAVCGRIVAHTKAGRAYLHRCGEGS